MVSAVNTVGTSSSEGLDSTQATVTPITGTSTVPAKIFVRAVATQPESA